MDYEEYCKMIEELMPEPAEIRREQQLSGDLGLCSFDMMMLTARIEAATGADLDVTRITKYTTVGELWQLCQISENGQAEQNGQVCQSDRAGKPGHIISADQSSQAEQTDPAGEAMQADSAAQAGQAEQAGGCDG